MFSFNSHVSFLVVFYVFIASSVLDLVWVLGVRRASQGKAFQSAFLSSLMTLLGAGIIIEYTRNLWYLVPAALGAFIGNYLAIKLDLHSHPKKRKHK